MRAAENDFEGTRTTIPRVRAETGQGSDGGALVFVHAGRGQDTCISEQYGGHTRASRVSLRADDDVFYLFLQKQNLGAKLHIYL